MVNTVDSIGFDLERVHTGLIVYLVDLWRDGEKEPLQTFFSELGVELQEAGEIKAIKEHESIDLVLLDQNDAPRAAIDLSKSETLSVGSRSHNLWKPISILRAAWSLSLFGVRRSQAAQAEPIRVGGTKQC